MSNKTIILDTGPLGDLKRLGDKGLEILDSLGDHFIIPNTIYRDELGGDVQEWIQPWVEKNTANGSLQILEVGLTFDPTDTASQQQWDWSLDKNGDPKQMGDAAISGSKWNMA